MKNIFQIKTKPKPESKLRVEENDYTIYKFTKRQAVFYIAIYSTFMFGSGMLFFRNIVPAILAIGIVPLLLKNKRGALFNKRNKNIRNEFCDALQIISVSLSSGKNINRAFIEAACELQILYGGASGLMVKEFLNISKKLSLNHGLKDALKDLAERTSCEEIRSFQEAEELCRITGGNITEIVKNTYQTILQKNETEDEIDVICAEQKLSFKILMCIPFVMLTIMSVFSPDYMSAAFTDKGQIFVIFSLIMIFFAYIAGSKILANSEDKYRNVRVEGSAKGLNKSIMAFLNSKFINIIYLKSNSVLRRYAYERKIRLYFSELFERLDEYYYELHRKKQISIGICIILLTVIVFMLAKVSAAIWCIAAAADVAVFVIGDRTIKERAMKRRKIIEAKLPVFLSKLAILTDAGITVKSGIERITVKMPENALKEQLLYLIRDFSYGKSDELCFENFARRCKTKGTASFSTLVLQSIKKGGREFSSILRIYAKSSWEKKRAEAKIGGEEKAMKLMFPTMLIFISLMLLMASPAIVNMM